MGSVRVARRSSTVRAHGLTLGLLVGLAGCNGVVHEAASDFGPGAPAGEPGTGVDTGGPADPNGTNGTNGTDGTSGGGPTVGPDNRFICDDTTHGALSEGRRLTTAEYQHAIDDLFGLAGSDKYPGSYGATQSGYSTEPAVSVIGEQGVEQLLYAAEDVVLALADRVSDLLPCADNGDQACAEEFLDTFGRRAFRRSLTAEERTSLLAVYSAERDDDATFPEAVAVMTSQLLQMPGFLYIVEAPAPSGSDRRLDGIEVASRLAFQFWDSPPDEQLLDKAEQGELQEPAAILAEAERLLADPRSDRGLVRFFREWTETPELAVALKDTDKFPYLNDAFVASVNESFDRFVMGQVRAGAGLYSLLRSNTAFVDDNMATLFDVAAPGGWAEVELPADRYTGIMTQPGLMAALAHHGESSFVYRGRFIRKRLMCDVIGTPPGNAMTEFAKLEIPSDPTGKDKSAAVRARPDCSGCHSLIDPPGLAFEVFDAMGAYRQAYDSGKPVDTTGTLTVIDGEPIEFTGAVDLMEQLASQPVVQECFGRQVFRYTASRLETDLDACAVQQIADALEASGGRLDRAFVEATQTDAFLYRRGE